MKKIKKYLLLLTKLALKSFGSVYNYRAYFFKRGRERIHKRGCGGLNLGTVKLGR